MMRVLLLTALIACLAQSAFGSRNDYMGCFRDNKTTRSHRDLERLSYSNNSNRINTCIASCGAKGYRFAGLQWSRECWCSNTYGRYGRASNCNMKCTGNRSYFCGGSLANSVYFTSRRISARGVSSSSRYIGCFKDTRTRDLGKLAINNNSVNVESCRAKCRQLRFVYAAVQYSRECWCGNSYGRWGTATNCNKNCRGNRNQTCGGDWANNVYESGVVASYNKVPEGFRRNYRGCFRDSRSPRDLPKLVLNSNAVTVETCIARCKVNRYRYAGVQYSRECWCGNSFGRHGLATNCNKTCRGNRGQFCGGDWANNVYDVQG